MEWLELLISFFLSNALGYGGGPASIPLMHQEIVVRHQWATDTAFSNMIALGNTLPGPIATKIAAIVGYDAAGWIGAGVALAATVVPSAAALVLLLKLLRNHRHSPVVKGMTLLVQPAIAVMMALLTWQMATASTASIGIWQSLAIAAVAYWLMERRNIHPAIVICGAFVYGALVLSHGFA
ncbi:transporter [Paenibacillus sp. 32O-W]|uniref:chromate transporter n=1 Tax=Paenibacillus sp. 32O-W TaxID=1695218 RepID=UPI000722D68E|nr:chromate transporter [Paenibacillus sp. 32O-W]ALS29681.1 transporter [Paenibacillus sp. 32O-W]